MTNAKLTEPMTSLLVRLATDTVPRTPGRSGKVPATSAALVRRGLAEITEDGLIRITEAGRAVTILPGDLVNYAACPLPEPFRVTAVVDGLVEANGLAGIPSAFVKVAEPVPFATTELYPLDHAFALTVVGTSDRVSEDTGNRMVWVTYPAYPDLAAEEIDPSNYTARPKVTAPDHTGWGVLRSNGVLQCVGVHATRDESEACAVRRGVQPPADPCCSSWSRGIDCGCADMLGLDDAIERDDEDDTEDKTVENWLAVGGRRMLVVGTALGEDGSAIGVDVTAPGTGLVETLTLDDLKNWDKVAAVCAHAYRTGSTCLSCAREDREIRYASRLHCRVVFEWTSPNERVELGEAVWHTTDNSYSGINADGAVIARHTEYPDVVRALVLDHKVSRWAEAIKDDNMFDVVRTGQINDTVRLLSTLGITTGTAFMDRLTELEAQDAEDKAVIRDRLKWGHVDHAAVLDSLEYTHPVRTDVHDGSTL